MIFRVTYRFREDRESHKIFIVNGTFVHDLASGCFLDIFRSKEQSMLLLLTNMIFAAAYRIREIIKTKFLKTASAPSDATGAWQLQELLKVVRVLRPVGLKKKRRRRGTFWCGDMPRLARGPASTVQGFSCIEADIIEETNIHMNMYVDMSN